MLPAILRSGTLLNCEDSAEKKMLCLRKGLKRMGVGEMKIIPISHPPKVNFID